MRTGWALSATVALSAAALAQDAGPAAPAAPDMAWWREARFGLFIHWGLYAVPAGKWAGKAAYGEWIMSHAQIPVEEYEKLKEGFNPVKFDAPAWARAAKAAGMRYVVITTKHHDGFCLFESKFTDYDVAATPLRRDVMKELAEACRQEGIRTCWYYSIMDWHHPDYLPRREWETRSAGDADFERYVAYMKNQLGELLTNYGPIGVLWFDGQWEGSWTHERAVDLERHIRRLQPSIIINNRIDKGGSAHGMNRAGEFVGDFGTPEQEVPVMGLPGVDWEACMTMNDHWGYNAADRTFKSTEELIRRLVDIAGKGGNFLLNVGPTAEGEIPAESLERLAAIGRWMEVNSESIHGTQAGPFPALVWGRCTQRALADGKTRLFLHVFDWPQDGRLVIEGLYNQPVGASLLADAGRSPLSVVVGDGRMVVTVPALGPDPVDSVVVLDVLGKPDVAIEPVISAPAPIFVESAEVTIATPRENVQLRFTLDGSEPVAASPLASGPVRLTQTATVSARAFRAGKPVSPVSRATFSRAEPAPAAAPAPTVPGLHYEYFEGDCRAVADLGPLRPKATGVASDLSRSQRLRESHFGFRYRGYIDVPADGAYVFALASDDGSRLFIDGRLLIDNDGLHSIDEKTGAVALARGLHPITIEFFESSGGHELDLSWEGPGMERRRVAASALRHSD